MAVTTYAAPLLQINSEDEDIRRRGRNTIIVALGLIGVTLVLGIFALSRIQANVILGLVAAPVSVHSGAIVLARRGAVDVAAIMMVVMSIIGILASQMIVPEASIMALFLLIPVLIAVVTLRPRSVCLTLVATWGALIIIALAPGDMPAVLHEEILIGSSLMITFAALIGVLSSSSTEHALYEAQLMRDQARTTSLALERTNYELEERVSERTSALQQALAAQEAQAEELQHALETQRQLDALVSELSVPVIPVRQDVLIVPLVGALHEERMNLLFKRMLQQVEEQHARSVILDITGVPVLDTPVAAALLRASEAARLLGARTLMVGIRPEVAQALVGLGVSLRGIETFATLQQGLEYLMANQGSYAGAKTR